MKERIRQVMKKIDALTLRERVIMFAMAAFGLVMLINLLLLDPQFKKQKALAQQTKQDRARITDLQALIKAKLDAQKSDPDAENKARLQGLKQQYQKLQNDLLQMHKVLVSPEKMNVLLEDMLKRNGKLRLLSLKTLPVSVLGEAEIAASSPVAANSSTPAANQLAEAAIARHKAEAAAAAPAAGAGKPPVPIQLAESAIYRHAVEITVQGSYLDMVAYMSELESMPGQLFWSKAKLNVD